MIGERFWIGSKSSGRLDIRLRDPEESEDRAIYASASKPFPQRSQRRQDRCLGSHNEESAH